MAKAKTKMLTYEQVLTLIEVSVVMLVPSPGADFTRTELMNEFKTMLPPNAVYADEDVDRAIRENCVCVDFGPNGGITYRMKR